jgi:hypothetical protein
MMEPVSLEARCARIRARLLDLSRSRIRWYFRWLWTQGFRRVFGADGHRFQLNEPLLESEVDAFESKYNVELPADYRAFLIHVGNGGAGPYHGLFGMTGLSTLFDDYESQVRWMSADCLLHDDLPRDDDDWIVAMGGTDWEDRWDRDEWHPYQGTFVLSEVGCGYYYVVLLNGRCRGRVCGVSLDFVAPLFPAKKTFLDWYEAWLDAVWYGKDELFESGGVFIG